MTGILDYLRRPDVRNALAMGFNAMSTRPDPYLNSMLQTRMENQRLAAGRQAAMEYLKGKAGAAPYIAALQAGASGPDAISAHTSDRAAMASGASRKTEADIQRFANGTVVKHFSDGSSEVFLPSGKQLLGEDAAKAIEAGIKADDEKNRRDAFIEQDSKNTANLYQDIVQQMKSLSSTIGNLVEAQDALEDGATSGLIRSKLPAFDAATADLRAAKNRLGLDVIGSTTFGALSENELKFALETNINFNLNPKQLQQQIERKIYVMKRMETALLEQALYLSRNDKQGYINMLKAASDRKVGETRFDRMKTSNLINLLNEETRLKKNNLDPVLSGSELQQLMAALERRNQ